MSTPNNVNFARQFGEFIRDGRQAKGLYQSDVAEMLSIGQTYYSYLENGQRNVDLVMAMNICKCLGLDLNEFLQGYPES